LAARFHFSSWPGRPEGRGPAIHAFAVEQKIVDGRDKHGHDEGGV